MAESVEIHAKVGAEKVSRAQVVAWESHRTEAVLRKFASRLGRRAWTELLPDHTLGDMVRSPLEVQRLTLTTLKSRMGHAGIYAMLRHELTLSEQMARFGVKASRGRTKHSVTHLEVPGYSAELFADWFNNLTVANAETDMVAACPDHYLLRGRADGCQEVVETTGGSPAASRFVVDYGQTDSLTIPITPGYPIQIAGRALLDDGLIIGGVRHQFRDNNGALEAKLTVQFPGTLPAKLIREHQWHLAVEFSNWIIAAAPVAATT
ncbi:hypothetical protein [Rhodococcus erythropolis]|uniref:hypothetical protein n=1 Tax=Rhodococcus erythropolis TaxID=1833 RepID=UPI001BEA8FF1|nr:hypothetical protein [Rhodococcus erythropolis]MBT2264406.1 hypothetical protein [Rhodococcus erythropolis]